MSHALPKRNQHPRTTKRTAFERLFEGYRFTVCEDPADVARVLSVRECVYRGDCGYPVAVPDEYDARSWHLLAEDAQTGEAVGALRITPKAMGPLEAEEYFSLPAAYRDVRTAEITRFAILPAYRTRTRVLPVVFFGLVKLAVLFMEQAGVRRLVVCSTADRLWAYGWLNITATGQTAPYGKLGDVPHELMLCDLPGAVQNHRFKEAIIRFPHPEITLPARVPALPSGQDVVGCRRLQAAGGVR